MRLIKANWGHPCVACVVVVVFLPSLPGDGSGATEEVPEPTCYEAETGPLNACTSLWGKTRNKCKNLFRKIGPVNRGLNIYHIRAHGPGVYNFRPMIVARSLRTNRSLHEVCA